MLAHILEPQIEAVGYKSIRSEITDRDVKNLFRIARARLKESPR